MFSPPFRSSPHCIPSPDGKLIATLLSSKVNIRSVESLNTVHEVSLPLADLSGTITSFLWSPSSHKVLVAAGSQIHVFGALSSDFRAVIRVPPPAVAKPTFIRFGPDDGFICAFAALGLKLSIFDLSSSKVAEINNPKFYQPLSAPRCTSFRPQTSHLAVLTRTSGRDVISIHAPTTWEVQRSWYPDLIDTQGLFWALGGKWLVAWESPSQGHKILFYTPDGHLFRTWTKPSTTLMSPELKHSELGPGIRQCQLSPDAAKIVVCDHTRFTYILDVSSGVETTRLHHPATPIAPKDTLQIWQEQLVPSHAPPVRVTHTFVKVTQAVSPPGPSASNNSATEKSSGCIAAVFDSSSSLLATKVEDCPSTVWIWDLSATELRAVLMFSSDITSFRWHSSIPELLLIACDGSDYNGVVFTWDPLSFGPRPLNCAEHFPNSRVASKWQASWLDSVGSPGVMLVADSNRYLLVALSESEETQPPWGHVHPSPSTGTASSDNKLFGQVSHMDVDTGLMDGTDDDASYTIEDTFSFKKAPRT